MRFPAAPSAAFRILGFPVSVHPSFLLVAVLGLTFGTLTLMVAWVAIVFVTTLVHELGHAFAFRAYGRSATVSLWAFGGFTQGSGGPLGRRRQIVVSVAGPLTGFALVGLPALLVRAAVAAPSPDAALVLDLFVFAGVGWAVLNMLPVLPLDGGHVSASVLEGVWGARGARAARWLSIVVATGGGAYAATRGFVFAAAFAFFFVVENWNDLVRLRADPVRERLAAGHARLDAGDAAAAARDAEALLGSARGALRNEAAELLAWAYLAQGRRADAAGALARLPADVRPSRFMLAATLLHDGYTADGIAAAVEGLLDAASTTGAWPPNAQLAMALERAGALGEIAARLLASDRTGANALSVLAWRLHDAGRYEAATHLSVRLYESPHADRGVSAYNAACGAARLGRVEEAIEWLERALDAGFADRERYERDEDLAAVRAAGGFERIRSRLTG